MSTYTIIMFNMSSYDEWERGIRNRNYFVLHELLKRPEIEKIIAIDYLPITARKNIKEKLKRLTKWQLPLSENAAREIDKKLTVCSIQNLKEIPDFIKQLVPEQTKTILWSYFPLYIDYFDTIHAEMKIFDTVDNWAEHPTYENKKELLRGNYQKIKKKCDIIFTVSDHLKKHLFNNDSKAHHIANGVDVRPATYHNTTKKIIGYVGTIQSRVDFDLVRRLAQDHDDKEFVFIGPLWDDAEHKHVKKLKNVHFTGRIPYDNLPKYLSKCSVGIIPHKIDEFTKSMDPMKFYDYLSFGLPVVSTQRVVKDSTLLYYAPDSDDFSKAINTAINENTEQLAERRIKFATQNSWEKRVGEMVDIIRKN